MHVGSIPGTAHEDPVRLAGLGDRGEKVGSLIVSPQGIGCRYVAVTPVHDI